MSALIRNITATVGWHLPFTRLLAPRSPVVLMYHGVPRGNRWSPVNGAVFESHVLFLKKHCEIVGPPALEDRRGSSERLRVLLTFDDGFRNNAELVAPILRRHQVPAIFFVCTRHASPGKYLWFSYLKMLRLCFRGNGFTYEGEHLDMSSERRSHTMKSLEEHLLAVQPHPTGMYQIIDEQLPRLEDFATQEQLNDSCAGMTDEQIQELAADPLFTIGAHTVDHPSLMRCDDQEVERQIRNNKQWIEKLTGRECEAIAYPNAEYRPTVIDICRRLGFTRGYAVNRSLNYDDKFEIQRTGIYASPLNELGFKMRWGKMARI
jgi:peptidoglycan/xylan/chitin deacetylase (PgdA/CDA1 family)